MNYYKVSLERCAKDGIDTFAHWTDGSRAVVSDMDVRRAQGFGLSPEDIQERYGAAPLTASELVNIRKSGEWAMNKAHGTIKK